MRESKFQSDLIRLIRSTGTKTFNIHGHEMQEAGWADLFVYGRVWTGFLELKVAARERSLQRKRGRELMERGTPMYFCRRQDDGLYIYGPDDQPIGHLEHGFDGRELLAFLTECDDYSASIGLLWRA